jgi:threonine dehydrogenase-like Zn-dependent dehydrogenase
MKAKMAFMYGPCDLRVEEVEVPQLKPDQIRGQVVQLGTAVQGVFKVGDKVTGDCVMACGVCRNCKDRLMPSACLNMREIGFRPDSPGGMGKYMVVEEQHVHAVPDDWSFEDAAWGKLFPSGISVSGATTVSSMPAIGR